MTPRAEAIAYRIWAFAMPRGWNVTVGQAAAHLGLSIPLVTSVCRRKRWIGRFRVTSTSDSAALGTAGRMFGIHMAGEQEAIRSLVGERAEVVE